MTFSNPFDLYTAELNRLNAGQSQDPLDIAIREQAKRIHKSTAAKYIEAYDRYINRNNLEL